MDYFWENWKNEQTRQKRGSTLRHRKPTPRHRPMPMHGKQFLGESKIGHCKPSGTPRRNQGKPRRSHATPRRKLLKNLKCCYICSISLALVHWMIEDPNE